MVKKITILLFLVVAQEALARHPFEEVIRHEMKKDGVPGMAYAILEDGLWTVGTLGVRSLERREPMTDATVFPLASVSKTFAGTLAAMMASKGQLDLKTRLKKDWPGFRLATEQAAERITLAHLLSHASGLVPHAYDNLLEAGKHIPDIIPQFSRLKPLCPPGDCYGYQNILFSLVQPALEKAGGKPWPRLVEERLFTPLGMTNSGVGFGFYKGASNKAMPHIKIGKRWWQRRHRIDYYRAPVAAGVNASVADMVLWVNALLGKRPDVLSRHAIRLAVTPRIESTRERHRRHWRDYVSKTWYGLGWRIYRFEHCDLILHGGGVSGFRSLVSFCPGTETALVLLLNGETRVHNKIATAFWKNSLEPRDQAAGQAATRGVAEGVAG